MINDAYGLAATTSSASALDAYNRAVQAYLEWSRESTELFQSAVRDDPRFALAQAGLAVSLFADERFDEARAATAAARAAVARGASERERGHVEALALFVDGRLGDAEALMREHLAAYPDDLFIAQRLYFVWFFQGRFDEMLALTTGLLARFGSQGLAGGLHAFVLEEVGRCDEALRLAESIMGQNPEDTWAVHSFAHALYEMGASDVGITRLPPAIEACSRTGPYRTHLVWHVALMHLALGDYERARAMTRDVFEGNPIPLSLDLRNSSALLWRYELCGMDVKVGWAPLVALGNTHLRWPALSPFHHAHLAMTLAGGGDWPAAERHLERLRGEVPPSGQGIIAEVVLPLSEGLHAFAAGDWQRTIEHIEPIRGRLIALGGSRTQRDVFHDTLLEASFRASDADRAERLLAERLARRADHYWVHRKLATA
jgi:tetratricopeptide (TPR) repeat protein